jgi:tetratricopeptide (TPR) repeat protein
MSLKQEIETWVSALAAYDNNEFDTSLRHFEQIADTSRILFNVGVINATLGEHAKAVEYYQRAVQLDQYLAVAYFQQGVSNFLMGDFEEALANFNDTLLYLRGNNNIDYEQLGLKFKLYSCEVVFNRGLCYIYLQQKDAGMKDLIAAACEKRVPDHDVIDEAIKEQAEGYTVFSIPVGIVYRPNEAKVKNIKTRDYLGKARLVAQQDQQNFDSRKQAALAAFAVDDRPEDKLSYAALNLVRPDLRSRSRQQSEPPMHRNVFPPTPPPEPERPDSIQMFARRGSNDSGKLSNSGRSHSRPNIKPLRLELGAAAFEQKAQPQTDRPRPAPRRAESERPAFRREYSGSSMRNHETRMREELRNHHDIPEVRVHPDPIEANPHAPERSQQRPVAHQRSKSNAQTMRSPPINQPVTISEEEELSNGSSDAAEAPLAFEIIPPSRTAHSRQRSSARRAPEIRKIRIKVHAEDMRYVMAVPDVTFLELAEQIRGKFGIGGSFKMKMKDEEGEFFHAYLLSLRCMEIVLTWNCR